MNDVSLSFGTGNGYLLFSVGLEFYSSDIKHVQCKTAVSVTAVVELIVCLSATP